MTNQQQIDELIEIASMSRMILTKTDKMIKELNKEMKPKTIKKSKISDELRAKLRGNLYKTQSKVRVAA